MIVKICGITRPQDAEAAVAAGADMLGFNFWPKSPRRVDLKSGRILAEGLKGSKALKVGVFVDPGPDEVRAAVEACSLDLVQLHGAESLDFVNRMDKPVIKALKVGTGGEIDLDLLQSYDMAKYIMLDSRDPWGGKGDSGGAWDWRQGVFVARKYSVILAGGLNPKNVAECVRAVRPAGVDVASGVETSPGVKNAKAIQAFIRAAREAAA